MVSRFLGYREATPILVKLLFSSFKTFKNVEFIFSSVVGETREKQLVLFCCVRLPELIKAVESGVTRQHRDA